MMYAVRLVACHLTIRLMKMKNLDGGIIVVALLYIARKGKRNVSNM